jgi:hypothetical protein
VDDASVAGGSAVVDETAARVVDVDDAAGPWTVDVTGGSSGLAGGSDGIKAENAMDATRAAMMMKKARSITEFLCWVSEEDDVTLAWVPHFVQNGASPMSAPHLAHMDICSKPQDIT